ncbi:MAG: hypothetical protein ACYC3F_01040 [Gemmatimonadaceae bacterium]
MPIQDVISELNRIRSAGLIADYAVGGAIAAQAYIETSSTSDIDVFVAVSGPAAQSLAPLGPIWADLTARGAKVDGLYLVIGDWPVQFLVPGTPLYDDAVTNARTKDFGGQIGRIMGPEHLAAIALATGRNKDYVRIEEFIRRGKVDSAVLAQLIERFGLQAEWKTFEARFLTPDA